MTIPLAESPLKRGGGYVELGDHVVVCSLGVVLFEVGLAVVAFLVVVLDGALELRIGRLAVVAREVVEIN